MNKIQIEKDLIWYFNHAEAAIGFKSSHSSFVASVYGVSIQNVETDHYTDGMLRNIRRIRRIHNQLYSLSIQSRRILEACYNLEYKYPIELIKIYGNKTGASLFNHFEMDLIQFKKLCHKKIHGKLSKLEEVKMFNIGEETRQLFNGAHKEYKGQ
jgi:hypothetical protein